MNTTFFSDIAQDAERENLRFLVVGGHAVNAYGYQRTTLDWDILVEVSTVPAWRTFWENKGYHCVHATDAFCQFRGKDNTTMYPVDLMIVSEGTFNKLWEHQQQRQIGDSLLSVPDPLHLIALKLHALNNIARAKQGKDLPDILGIIRHCNIDIESSDYISVMSKYGNEDIQTYIKSKLEE